MSPGLISRSPDLKRLRDEGYEVKVEKGYLLIGHVPYVNAQKQVVYGTLISTLDLSGDRTAKPGTHVALWAGDYPCDSKGSQLVSLVNEQNKNEKIRDGLVATFSFSQKPRDEGYLDYYEKMTAYVRMLEGHALALDPSVTSQTFPVIAPDDEESVFCYLDTASSRAGISAVNDKLKKGKIAIVGLGGTGAYVMDLVAKTPIEEIHLFDGDDLLQHNAFRSPGAPSSDDLAKKPKKVEWFAEIYSRMRRKIFPHAQFIDEKNVAELKQMDFVFLCIEGTRKKIIVDYLIENKIPFIDVGIGMYDENDTLGGNARVTTCTPAFHNHLAKRIDFGEGEENEYSRNIQIADMNALNAALAVIKWKKMQGFYFDLEHEHDTTYGLITNLLVNGDIVDETKSDQT
jgi:hypothetical protein